MSMSTKSNGNSNTATKPTPVEDVRGDNNWMAMVSIIIMIIIAV